MEVTHHDVAAADDGGAADNGSDQAASRRQRICPQDESPRFTDTLVEFAALRNRLEGDPPHRIAPDAAHGIDHGHEAVSYSPEEITRARSFSSGKPRCTW
jgi:hypothetical protein